MVMYLIIQIVHREQPGSAKHGADMEQTRSSTEREYSRTDQGPVRSKADLHPFESHFISQISNVSAFW